MGIGRLLHKAGFIGVGLTIGCMIFVYGGTFREFAEKDTFHPDCMDGVTVPYQSTWVNTGGDGISFQSFLDLFSVSSYMVFIFAIVVTVPTLRHTMQNKEKLTPMSVIAFIIVAVEFLVIMFAYYWVFGNLGPQNVIEGM